MGELANARAEIRQGNFASAERILDAVLAHSDEITSHLLFDLASAYEDLFNATRRYEDLITASRHCAKKAAHLPSMDQEIHSAHALLIVAGAEIALGRKYDAERNTHAAERLLDQFPAERFSANSRGRVTSMRVRARSLRAAISARDVSLPSTDATTGANVRFGPEDWRNFASQKNLTGKDVKACFARLRRSAGWPESLTIVVDWAVGTPRVGNIGASSDVFATFLEELTSLIVAHPISFDNQRSLSRMLHEWNRGEGLWLQRLINVNRKCGVAEKLQRLRRAAETKVEQALNSIENKLAGLESLDNATILDGDGARDYESDLLRLDGEVAELRTLVVSPSIARLNLVQNRLTQIIARVDYENSRRNEVYARLRDAIEKASDGAALANLKIAVKEQLPAVMWQRAELQAAIRQTDDRLVMAELEVVARQERAALREKLNGIRGVDVANLLFKEYGIDLATARQLVMDRNKGEIDLNQLLDRVLERGRIQRLP